MNRLPLTICDTGFLERRNLRREVVAEGGKLPGSTTVKPAFLIAGMNALCQSLSSCAVLNSVPTTLLVCWSFHRPMKQASISSRPQKK